jgi:FtsZ-binding cell division protein ZapB
MQRILKKTISEKIILDREHQKIVTELDGTIDRLEKELQEVKNIDKNHQRINGLLRKDVEKLTKENEQLKKENEVIREGNDYIGVFQQDLKDRFKKLSDDMTANVKAAVPVVKKYNHNILFMKSVQALIRFNTELEQILKKFTKN